MKARVSVLRVALFAFAACVAILVGCGDDTTEPKNQVPSTPTITPAGFTIMPDDSVLLTAAATDPDGDALTFRWSMSAGTPLTATGSQVVWHAPAEANPAVNIEVVARDTHGGERAASIPIVVHPNAAYPYAKPFAQTLAPDLSQLGEGALLASGPAQSCHFLASTVVLWTDVVVFAFTGLPTVAFAEALTRTPVWIFPATWIWAYTVPWGTSYATIELNGTLVEVTEIDWTMLVSGTMQGLTRFSWVTGHSNTDGHSGSWTLYDIRVPQTQTEALRIDWSRAAQDEVDLNYHNILATSDTYGDSLNYSLDGTLAAVALHDVSEGTSTRVHWDTLTGDGKLIGAAGDSCCWGPAPTFSDVDCD